MRLRLAHRAAGVAMRRLGCGTLTVLDGDGTRHYGSGGPRATVQVRSTRVWWMALRGSRGLADAYAAGLWDSPDLVATIRLAASYARPMDRLRRASVPLRAPGRWLRALLRPSTRRTRRREIAAHYDLGNDLFSHMLDPTMSYSCAVFARAGMDLEEAQRAKFELVCERLELEAHHEVVEIGSGWGGFAIHAALTRGCHVTTTTISREQHDYAVESVRRAGVEDRVRVLAADYRDLRGRYDRLVSIEMIEAVGWRHFGSYFRSCADLLRPGGAMLLQAITVADDLYELEKSSRSFIRSRIFPGGCLPSMRVIEREVARNTDLAIRATELLTGHYIETLRRWRERFVANEPELAALGYDERFRRLWRLYLAYCEAGFAERRIESVQLLLGRPGALGSTRGGRRRGGVESAAAMTV
ncbi:MAG: class I SAM-dependent methyltransferase [Acidobacteriota bacterium]|nr:class I SAM-dependent methyltransferase [Acidobacteriota bacterium]